MIDTNELRGLIAKNGLSQVKVAQTLGMTPKTFYGKMKKGVFDSDEMENMVEILHIKNPCEIFFPTLSPDKLQEIEKVAKNIKTE